ncbi:DUF5930 domain-containing protein [Roseitranquillus sediminis]|uniref:DUF5930 domain-containing protein n=1 Tax=Roseitranquillus sediminis TaxID=2809051 RepID=UPI001D0C9394|nr:DUF5930 domain-containing protein [Roseitranquillus sediminis]MBM9595371.1 peptidoglycan DD-metalloendopeptidase family protein [Roseitranquillus sediminis]
MATGGFSRLSSAVGRVIPEQRLFLKSDDRTRLVRLGPIPQLTALTGVTLVVGWSILSASIIAMDAIGSGSLRDQAQRERAVYEERLAALAAERDARTGEAHRAQDRFAAAMDRISQMQSELLSSEERRKELRIGLGVVQDTLRRTMNERDGASAEAEILQARLDESSAENDSDGVRLAEAEGTLDMLAQALTQTAVERDTLAGVAAESQAYVEELVLDSQLAAERNDRIFAQLEEAVSVSMEPLDEMFRSVGLEPDTLLEKVRSGREPQQLGSIRLSTKGGEPHADATRANGILNRLSEMDAYREATEKAPFAVPLKTAYRHTSGFGPRWGRQHEGTDFAGAHGSPILATADGVVTFAGRQSGYGNIVKIRHEFGIETRYAHLSRLKVEVGQRVSRGDQIGDMGNTGRSTGTHLHYEVRVNGTPIDPMTYIKAARDVL